MDIIKKNHNIKFNKLINITILILTLGRSDGSNIGFVGFWLKNNRLYKGIKKPPEGGYSHLLILVFLVCSLVVFGGFCNRYGRIDRVTGLARNTALTVQGAGFCRHALGIIQYGSRHLVG